MNSRQDAYKSFYKYVNQRHIMKEFYDLIAPYFLQNYKKKKKIKFQVIILRITIKSEVLIPYIVFIVELSRKFRSVMEF